MAAKKRTSRGEVPAGFRKVETTLAGFWKPTQEGESIRGVVGAAIEVKGADGKANYFFPLKLTSGTGGPVVDNKDKEIVILEPGMVVGIGGKMLFSFLSDREGQEVFLVYRGLGRPKPGQSAPKMYDTYEAES